MSTDKIQKIEVDDMKSPAKDENFVLDCTCTFLELDKVFITTVPVDNYTYQTYLIIDMFS